MSYVDIQCEEFSTTATSISTLLTSLETVSTPAELSDVENMIAELRSTLATLSMEVRSQESSTRVLMSKRMDEFKETLKGLQSRLAALKDASSKADLLGGSSKAQRQKATDANTKYVVHTVSTG